MKETTPARTSHGGESNSPPVSSAMPPCFDRWCKKFDDLLRVSIILELIKRTSYQKSFLAKITVLVSMGLIFWG